MPVDITDILSIVEAQEQWRQRQTKLLSMLCPAKRAPRLLKVRFLNRRNRPTHRRLTKRSSRRL